ncbi:hypothetical protein WA026_000434 [Henosepilachna vigintioctopunctata]|uniref:SKP1 component POZ domain-containing protein n=1 Tax=Henosepilachna vigintioctopunctata TaxID=420089 RepID=A0AAW1V3U3_9CUCU
MSKMPELKLQCQHGEIVKVYYDVMKCSNLIKIMVHHSGPEVVLDISGLSASSVRKVIEWAEVHKYDPPEIQHGIVNPDGTCIITDFDVKFTLREFQSIGEILFACQYLQINRLSTIINYILKKQNEHLAKILSNGQKWNK